MKYLVIAIALLLSGAAYAAPDCSNFGGSNLVGCGAEDFSVDMTQDSDHKNDISVYSDTVDAGIGAFD